MVDKFLEGYGTVDNYLRVYGGTVISDNSRKESDQNGNFGIYFSRPVIFPTKLIQEYNSAYIEQVPELKPTDKELYEIKAEFKEYQESFETKDKTYTVTKTRTVCEKKPEKPGG